MTRARFSIWMNCWTALGSCRRLIDYQMFAILLFNERDRLETYSAVRSGERYVLSNAFRSSRSGRCGGGRSLAYAPDAAGDTRYHMVNPLTRSELAVPPFTKRR
jgi:hypothetical protein